MAVVAVKAEVAVALVGNPRPALSVPVVVLPATPVVRLWAGAVVLTVVAGVISPGSPVVVSGRARRLPWVTSGVGEAPVVATEAVVVLGAREVLGWATEVDEGSPRVAATPSGAGLGVVISGATADVVVRLRARAVVEVEVLAAGAEVGNVVEAGT